MILLLCCVYLSVGVLLAPYHDTKGCNITAYEPQYPSSDWIALVERGVCEFQQKAESALHHGAKAMVVFMHNDDSPDTLMQGIPGMWFISPDILYNLI